MSFCHECGEQVANEDVFCPFCGITLVPAVPVADDISMSETIVGFTPPAPPEPSPLDDATPAPAAVAVAAETPSEVSFGETTLPPATPPPSPFEAPTSTEEPVAVAAPAKEEISSAPSEAEVGETQADAVPPVVVEAPPSAVDAAVEVDEPESVPVEVAADEVPVAASEQPLTLETAAPAVPEEPTVPAVPVAADEPDIYTLPPDLIGEPEPPALIAEEIPDSFAAPEEAVAFSRPADSAPLEIEDFADAPTAIEPVPPVAVSEPVPVSDPVVAMPEPPVEPPAEPVVPIAMPVKELVLEPAEPEARIDSVRMIENQVAEKRAADAEKPAASGDVASKPAGSFTSPNIGGSDTGDGRKVAKLKPLDEGVVLNGRYEIVRKIGGGGMGAVYLANDRNLGGVLRAVKEMVQSYIESEQQEKAINDFKRESLLLTSLDHPAIPTIYDYFFDDKEGRFYLVMKYISGGDLAGRLRSAPEGKIDEKSVVEWAIQVADVLDYLHNHEPSIVYRDLKPANVMIDGNSGRVMLIDFGIARWVNKEEKGVTAVGTMGYAPPELFSGNVEPRSDIYSLGSTMFHLLTGADPQSNPLLIFDFQKNPRPRQINSRLTDQIEQILMRSVEYNADLRFSSAAELRDTLKDHFANLAAGRVTYGVSAAPSARTFADQNVFCGFCGKQIVATDVFCAFCGAQQPIAQQGAAPSAPIQPVTAKLTILATGELEPSTFRLEKNDNLLGRRDPMSNIFPEVDLSKYDPQTKISRRHARVWREGNSFLVEDLGSSNGTTLLSTSADPVRLLPHQPHSLTNGDRLKLGDTMLHFTVG